MRSLQFNLYLDLEPNQLNNPDNPHLYIIIHTTDALTFYGGLHQDYQTLAKSFGQDLNNSIGEGEFYINNENNLCLYRDPKISRFPEMGSKVFQNKLALELRANYGQTITDLILDPKDH